MQLFKPSAIDQREFWHAIKNNSLAGQYLQTIKTFLPQIPARLPTPTAVDFLAARRSNNRGIVDDHWRNVRLHLARLVANRLLKGDDLGEYDDRLLNWIYDYVFESTWMVSAHLPFLELQLAGSGQLDLAGCEMAAELAELREVLLPWLQGQSQTLDRSIIHEIDRRCLTPFVDPSLKWWADLADLHPNNWTGVCAGGLLTACLALEAQGVSRPEARQKAITVLNHFFAHAFTAGGECDEGPGYWNYGMEYACMPLMRMSLAQIEASFDLARIRQIAAYPERIHIYGDFFFASNDGGSKLHAITGQMAWLADFANSSFLRWWTANYPAGPGRSVNTLLRDLAAAPTIATWKTTAPTPQAARYLPDQQVAIFQRNSSRGLFTATFSGGHNAESHNHNDLGTFQIILDNIAWVPDLGMPIYTTDFFSKVRYTKYLVAASAGHCCPAINGQEQRAGHEAAGKLLHYHPQNGQMALDLTAAYPPEAQLASWKRTLTVPPASAEAALVDEFVLQQDGQIVHRLWFREKPIIAGNTLTCGPLSISISPAPANTQLHPFRADDPRLLLREYSPDHHLYRVDLTYLAKANQALQITTSIKLI